MIRIAVLGCGRIGAMHAANIAAHPSARLTAVQDINGAASDVFAGYRAYSLDNATATTGQNTISTLIAGLTVHF